MQIASVPSDDTAARAEIGARLAFDEVYDTHFEFTYRVVVRLAGLGHAEDLTQEGFLGVYQGLPKFSLRCRFTTWLFQVTKNRVLDELRAVERISPPMSRKN